jgi:ABC-2 type transport system permease protein
MNGISVWRIEWWRLVRTRRLLALLIVFVFLGFVEPLGARYASQLINSAGSAEQIKVTVPPPVPADGISAFMGDALVLGLLVSVVVAAYACAIDSNPALSVFYRTRARSFSALLLPRVAVVSGGVIGAFLVGLLVAWYETAVLIGAPEVGPMLYSALLGSVYLAFAVTVTALAGALVRSRLAAVGVSVVILLLLPILGELPGFSRWMPSQLVGASSALLRHTAADHFPRALAMAVLLGAVALVAASVRGARREVG